MSRYIKYKPKTEGYEKIIESFLDKFYQTFPNYYPKNKLKKFLYKNLKKIKKRKQDSTIQLPLLGYIQGLYHRSFKTLLYTENEEETIIHELLHALSAHATKKRESIPKIIAILFFGQKQLSQRGLEEGITEYLTGRLSSKEYQYMSDTFSNEKNLVDKLAKIYGDKVILDYYLGYNNHLIELINKNNPNNFRQINYILNNLSPERNAGVRVYDEFSGIIYYDQNGKELEEHLIFDLFCQEKLKPNNTIENFKYNIHELFVYFEADLYRTCWNIENLENTIEEDELNQTDNAIKGFHQASLNQELEKFSKFNSIIYNQWKQLGINDDKLYNTILLEEIIKFDKTLTPIILRYLNYWNKELNNVYIEHQRNAKLQENTQSIKIQESPNLNDTQSLTERVDGPKR